MRRNICETVDYGGSRSGHVSYSPSSDELVLERDDIAFVLKALRRGCQSDRNFARQMFNTLSPHMKCVSCGRRINVSENQPFIWSTRQSERVVLCNTCNHIFQDVIYCLEQEKVNSQFPRYAVDPLTALRSMQDSRAEWCKPKINYMVNRNTYDRCLAKYKEVICSFESNEVSTNDNAKTKEDNNEEKN